MTGSETHILPTCVLYTHISTVFLYPRGVYKYTLCFIYCREGSIKYYREVYKYYRGVYKYYREVHKYYRGVYKYYRVVYKYYKGCINIIERCINIITSY